MRYPDKGAAGAGEPAQQKGDLDCVRDALQKRMCADISKQERPLLVRACTMVFVRVRLTCDYQWMMDWVKETMKALKPHPEAVKATGWWGQVIYPPPPGVRFTCLFVRHGLPSVWWSSWKPTTLASGAMGCTLPGKVMSTPKDLVSASLPRSRRSSDTCSSRGCGSTSAGEDSTFVRGQRMEQGRRRRRRRVLGGGGPKSAPPLHHLSPKLSTSIGRLTTPVVGHNS